MIYERQIGSFKLASLNSSYAVMGGNDPPCIYFVESPLEGAILNLALGITLNGFNLSNEVSRL